MKTVSPFEANLLRILQGFLDVGTPGKNLALIEATIDAPPCLSRDAVDLVQDSLEKGVVQYLAQQGGWRRERFLRDEETSTGRLWERTPPEKLGLRFSRASVEFLLWITAFDPRETWWKPSPKPETLTIGDRVLFLLAYRSLRSTEAVTAVMKQPPFRDHALIWLMDLPNHLKRKCPKSWDFSPWFSEPGSIVFECLQSTLAEGWQDAERRKTETTKAETILKLGTLQDDIGTALFDSAETANRRDLCRFFILAVKHCVHEQRTPLAIPKQHLEHLRLSERIDIYQAAASSYRLMERIERWNREAGATGFYDDGYAAAQLWKSDWETHQGDQLLQETQARLRSVEPLAMGQRTDGESGEQE